MSALSDGTLNVWECCHTERFTRQNMHTWIRTCMFVIFAIEDILYHELRHLAPLLVCVVAVGWWLARQRLSVHPDVDARGCVHFLWALKEPTLTYKIETTQKKVKKIQKAKSFRWRQQQDENEDEESCVGGGWVGVGCAFLQTKCNKCHTVVSYRCLILLQEVL